MHKTVITKLTLEEPVDVRIERVFLKNAMDNWSVLLQHVAVEKSRWFFKMKYSEKQQSLKYIYLVPVPQATHSGAFNDLWHGPHLLPSQSGQQETQERLKELLRVLHELKDQFLLELALLNNMVGISFAGADRLSVVPKLCAAPLRHACDLTQYEVD